MLLIIRCFRNTLGQRSLILMHNAYNPLRISFVEQKAHFLSQRNIDIMLNLRRPLRVRLAFHSGKVLNYPESQATIAIKEGNHGRR